MNYILYYKEMPTKPVFPYILKSQGGSILSTARLIGLILNNSVTKKENLFLNQYFYKYLR